MPGEAGQQIGELRELDLELAFSRPRAAREDVQNELRPVNHAKVQGFFQVSELRWGQVMTENHRLRSCRLRFPANLFQLPATHKRGRVRLRRALAS